MPEVHSSGATRSAVNPSGPTCCMESASAAVGLCLKMQLAGDGRATVILAWEAARVFKALCGALWCIAAVRRKVLQNSHAWRGHSCT